MGPRAGLDGRKISSVPTGIRSPYRPSCSESLYRLSYPGPLVYGLEYSLFEAVRPANNKDMQSACKVDSENVLFRVTADSLDRLPADKNERCFRWQLSGSSAGILMNY